MKESTRKKGGAKNMQFQKNSIMFLTTSILVLMLPLANTFTTAFTVFNSLDTRHSIHNVRTASRSTSRTTSTAIKAATIPKMKVVPPAIMIPNRPRLFPLYSTPFDVSLYDNDDNDDNPFFDGLNPLACPPNTNLIIGLNKYSHDTSICAADASSGQVLFALSKERLSRKKHHGGNVATIVEQCLDALQLDLDCITNVVSNNHHHRTLAYVEGGKGCASSMEWEEGLNINGGSEVGYTDEENVLSHANHVELSHHLAHAYSAATQCPFSSGMVVVMDGMGETYRTMKGAIENDDGKNSYVNDLLFDGEFECIPSDIDERSKNSVYDWREGESVYEFTKDSTGISVKPIFKRFVEERTPPALYNHGFENMDSIGALYSRASSHIFGDWNACGKVMGLAPWMGHEWTKSNDKNKNRGGDDDEDKITAAHLTHPIMKGKLYEEGEGGIKIDRSTLMRTPFIARNDPDLFDNEGNMIRKRRYDFDDNETIMDAPADGQFPTNVALESISLSYRIQQDLESVALDFVKTMKEKTKQNNLCLAGGVALNSVLNGRLSRELGFKNVFIPPYPGDDGIAIGCCAYGIFGNKALDELKETDSESGLESERKPQMWSEPLSPYQGPEYNRDAILSEIEAASPWIEVERVTEDKVRYEMMSAEIESGGVIALFQGRSEMGPRALGHRSIIADPRKKGLVRFINEIVKKRESFRPFAPSCLAEEAEKWFNLGEDLEDASNISPYMSMTAMVKDDKLGQIPAVTHVDGSSRLQTVTKDAEPKYHAFISTFFERTGVPMVLNTSFNTLPGEPIVETPRDAIRSFLSSMGSIEILFMDEYVIRRKPADVRRLLGEKNAQGIITPPTCPKRAGPAYYESKFTVGASSPNEEQDEVDLTTRISMPNRLLHDERDGGWFHLLDELEGEILGVCDGKIGVNEIVNEYLQASEEGFVGKEAQNIEYQEILFSNVMKRLIRLYEYTFISW